MRLRAIAFLALGLLTNKEGGPLDEARLRKAFAKVLRKASLSKFRPYDLRHTFASQLLARGGPITYVAAQLGHSKPTTTSRWYAKWLPGEDQHLVDLLDRPVPNFGTKTRLREKAIQK